MTRQRYGDVHPEVSVATTWLSTIYSELARNAEAEATLKRALAAFEKTLGPNHPEVAASLKSLATLYRVQGRADEAEVLSRRAQAIERAGR